MKKTILSKKTKKKDTIDSFSSPSSSSNSLNPILQNQILTQQMLMQLSALTQNMNQQNSSKMDSFLNSLSNNKIFIGFIMIMLNIGGRYLTMELPKNIDYLFTSSWMRLLIVFCISFMGTRDIKISIIITLIFVLLMKFLLHEESKICLLPKRNFNQNSSMNQNSNPIIEKQQEKEQERNTKVEGLPLPLQSPVIIMKAK
jgi:hypothetical protein